MWWPKDFYCEIPIQRSGEKDTYHDQLWKGSLNDAFNIVIGWVYSKICVSRVLETVFLEFTFPEIIFFVGGIGMF